MENQPESPPTPEKGIFRKIGSLIAKGWRLIRLVFYFFLGAYRPPPWLRLIFFSPWYLIREENRLMKLWRNKHPLSFWIGYPGIIVLVFVGLWWGFQPTPPTIKIRINPPGLTSLYEGARPDSVYLRFTKPAARLNDANREITKHISIDPPLAGKFRWLKDRRIRFTPEKEWGVGTEYTIEMQPALFPAHVTLEDYSPSFRSAPFGARITKGEFYQDPKDPKLKKVVVSLKFTHPVNTDDFRNRVSLETEENQLGNMGPDGKALGFEVQYNENFSEAYIHTNPIKLPPKDTKIKVLIDRGVLARAGGKGSPKDMANVQKIPGSETFFRVRSAKLMVVDNEKLESDQVLVIESSAGVSPEELKKNLAVFLLPKDRPPMQGLPKQKNYNWLNNADEVGAEVLKKSTSVTLEALPAELNYPKIHSFKVNVPERKYISLRVKRGTTAHGDFRLNRGFQRVIRVPKYPKMIKIAHQGSVMSLSGDKKIRYVARGVEAVYVEAARIKRSDIHHLISTTYGNFNSPEFLNYNFNQNNLGASGALVMTIPRGKPGKIQNRVINFSKTVAARTRQKTGLYLLTMREYNPRRKRPGKTHDRRLILITDLGVLVKESQNGDQDVFVQSFSTGKPVGGVRVALLAKNGEALRAGITDASGRIHLKKVENPYGNRYPTVYLVSKGLDVSFLPHSKFDLSLSYSRFDVGGDYSSLTKKGLDAFLFSDRGIYRPGNTFRVGAIIKGTDWKRSLQGLPLEFVLKNPQGLEVERRPLKLSPSGFEEISYKTETTSPTGTYTATLYIVKGKRKSALGSEELKLEEFLPDNMKISMRIAGEGQGGWVKPENLKGQVNLRTLYGTPAAKHKISASFSLSPAPPSFPKYKDYLFHDPALAENHFSQQLPDALTNAKGEAEVPVNLSRYADATYRLTLRVRGHEATGGRSVGAHGRVLVSPLPYIIGYKPDGRMDYLKKGRVRKVHLLGVNSELNPIKVRGLITTLTEERFVSVLARQDDGTFKYQSVKKKIPHGKGKLNLSAKGTHYTLPTNKVGNFILRILRGDDKEVTLAKIPFSVVGEGDMKRSLEKNAELQVKLNKSDYAPGSTIEMQVVAPYTGAGLITIEREKVLAHKWFRASRNSTIQTIQVPYGLEGNAYVNVTFLRNPGNKEIFMSPLSYGVVPFTIQRGARTHTIDLDVPSLAKPGEPFKVGYKSNKPGKVLLMAVDEGILRVSSHKTPRPLDYFFRKRALNVSTRQILEQLLPEYKMDKLSLAPGGGMADKFQARAKKMLRANLNPFRREEFQPVAYWSGLRELGPKGGTWEIPIPDHFNGTLRVMAVAVSPSTVGANAAHALVRGPFVLSPSVPRFVAPGDKFQVGLSVANTLKNSGPKAKVSVTLKPSAHLKLIGPSTREIEVPEGSQSILYFDAVALPRPGAAEIKFKASLGGESVNYRATLSVRPASPYATHISAAYSDSSKEALPVTRKLFSAFHVREASVSRTPLGLTKGLRTYLEKYPYVCTEQLISRAFPAVVLKDHPSLRLDAAKEEGEIKNTLKVLKSRQASDGAFGVWASTSYVSDFQAAYALHFLKEARERHIPLPSGLEAGAIKYLKRVAQAPVNTMSEARERAYAIYMLTRYAIMTPGYIIDLQARLNRDFKGKWESDLTGVLLAATYQLLKLEKEADNLISQAKLGLELTPDYLFFYDGMVHDAMLLYILAKHFPEKVKEIDAKELAVFGTHIKNGRYNSLSSALTILALEAYSSSMRPEDAGFAIAEILGGGKSNPLTLKTGLVSRTGFGQGVEQIQFTQKTGGPMFYQVTEAGFDLTPPKKELSEKLEVSRQFLDKDGKEATEVKLGDTLEVRVTLRGNGTTGQVALVDMLPGGFEVDLKSIRAGRSSEAGRQKNRIPRLRRGQNQNLRTTVENMMERLRNQEGGINITPEEAENLERLTRSAGRDDSGRVVLRGEGDGEIEREIERKRAPWAPPPFPEYVDAREDRLLLFGTPTQSVREFSYKIRAVSVGTFAVPPIIAEGMYDREAKARSSAGNITVNKR